MPQLMTTACVAALAFSSLVGCAARTEPMMATTSTTPTPPATHAVVAPPVTPAATTPWVDLRVGQCITEVPAVDVGETTVTVVDCAAPHRAEVYLLAPVPVNAAIAGVADRACAAGLDGYTGGRSGLSVTYLIDSKQDRTASIPLPSTVICLLQDAGSAPLTGSAHA